ncbi:hypothetical protein VTN96DRAFT_4529 [Rasamsonia emersonii]
MKPPDRCCTALSSSAQDGHPLPLVSSLPFSPLCVPPPSGVGRPRSTSLQHLTLFCRSFLSANPLSGCSSSGLHSRSPAAFVLCLRCRGGRGLLVWSLPRLPRAHPYLHTYIHRVPAAGQPHNITRSTVDLASRSTLDRCVRSPTGRYLCCACDTATHQALGPASFRA